MKYILNIEIWHKPPNRDNESKLINQESEIKISTNCFPCFCFQLNYSYKEQFIGVIINLKLDSVQSSPPVQTRLKRTEPKYISINKTYVLRLYNVIHKDYIRLSNIISLIRSLFT